MKDYRSVNQAFADRLELEGRGLEVEGILCVEPEGYYLAHYPSAERAKGTSGSDFGLWLKFGNGSLSPNLSKLQQWVGKRVRVYGVLGLRELPPPSETMVGVEFGHKGPSAFIEPYSLQRLDAEQRRSEAEK